MLPLRSLFVWGILPLRLLLGYVSKNSKTGLIKNPCSFSYKHETVFICSVTATNCVLASPLSHRVSIKNLGNSLIWCHHFSINKTISFGLILNIFHCRILISHYTRSSHWLTIVYRAHLFPAPSALTSVGAWNWPWSLWQSPNAPNHSPHPPTAFQRTSCWTLTAHHCPFPLRLKVWPHCTVVCMCGGVVGQGKGEGRRIMAHPWLSSG